MEGAEDPQLKTILDRGGPLTIELHKLLLELFPDAVLTADNENIGYGTTTGYQNAASASGFSSAVKAKAGGGSRPGVS